MQSLFLAAAAIGLVSLCAGQRLGLDIHAGNMLGKGFRDTVMLSGNPALTTPTQLTFLPDGRVLIAERTGTIFIADPTKAGFPMEPYLELESVSAIDETGLLSVILDPEWEQGSQHLYVFWTREHSGESLEGGYISRFTHVENKGALTSRALASSEQVLWFDTDRFANGYRWHYGGQLSWGPDGEN